MPQSNDTKINILNKEIDETKALLQKNTDKIVERNNHLEEIEHATASLSLSSGRFRVKSKKLKQNMCLEKYYPLFLFVMFIVIILIIIILSGKNKNKN